MRKVILVAAILSAVLAACGGGGGDSAAPASGGSPASGPNAFDSVLGTYKSGCVVRPNPGGTQSEDVTIVISDAVGSDRAKIVVTEKYYDVTTDCTGNLQESYVLTGQITAAAVTKAITVGTKTGVAKTAQLKLDAISVSKGTFTIPTPGATTKVGYLIEGANLYGLSGKREADGLPDGFSRVVLVKQ